MITVAEYLADFLVTKNVAHVFGFQGGAILKLIDAMMDTGKIKYVQNYHEQASAFCADAYSRVTRNIGVAIATSGPGATNLITGIANAHLDSIPTLFITGQDYSTNAYKNNGARLNGFQDLDIVSVVKPITKYAAVISDETRIKYELEKAFYIAKSGRPGAVLLDIPIDVQFKMIDPSSLDGFDVPDMEDDLICLDNIIDNIKHSLRPVVLAGGGVHIANAENEFKQFILKTKIPVVTTLNGLDSVDGAYSFAGLHGNTFSNLAVQNADLLIVLGARLGQRQVGKDPKKYTSAKIIHVDADVSELGRVLHEDISVLSDLRKFLQTLNHKIYDDLFPDYSAWHETIMGWEKKYESTTHLNVYGLDPVKVIKSLLKYFNEDAVITNDVGQNQMWVSQSFKRMGQQRLLNSSGLGSMGYSLPASIAAKYARPNSQVIAFTGDGGLHMNIQELMLIGHKQLGIKCIVLNNNTLGMMREVQKRYYKSHYYGASTDDFVCADLEKIALAYGLGYRKIDCESQISDLDILLSDDKPYIVDVRVAYDSLLSNRYDEYKIFDDERITA